MHAGDRGSRRRRSNFGEVNVGERAEQVLTIANRGHADLGHQRGLQVEGRYFRVRWEGEMVLEVGEEGEDSGMV
jgi:hypothetical protein